MMIFRAIHRAYKVAISPLFGNVCRFEPCCSDYALKAVETHGIFKGVGLAVLRLLKCHPYHPGGVDPVPPR